MVEDARLHVLCMPKMVPIQHSIRLNLMKLTTLLLLLSC